MTASSVSATALLHGKAPAVLGIPGGSGVRNLPANAGEVGLIPGSGRCPGEGNGNPRHYFCLGNPMDTGAWWLQSMTSQRAGHDLMTKQKPAVLPLGQKSTK